MCKYCEMKITEISDCAGEIFPESNYGNHDKICILNGNILSGMYDSRIEIKFCPFCKEELYYKGE